VGSPPAQLAPEGSLRERAARGTVINAGFNVALQLLGFLRGWLVAGFLTATQYGVWGLLVISLGTLLWLAQIGIDDKYIQQDHPDQEKAFQLAFTLQCMLAALFTVILGAGIPLFAIAYHQPEIIAPGLVLTLAMPTAALTTPLWVYYRKMDFLKQRQLALWDPLTAFVVTIALAVAGTGYWCLVLGTLAGSWARAIVAVRASPYPLRLYYEKGTLREYATFSYPILISTASGILVAQVPILFVQRHLGTAAIGAITLAGTISLYANRVDEIVTQTLYPAIARVKDKPALLFEAFTKSNRLALMWGVPCGVGIALFAHDIVHHVLGDKWLFAVPVLQIMALTAGFNQFGFNWAAFYKAADNTRPIAITGIVMMVSTLALAVPLTFADGLRGYALGMAGATVILILMRCWYLARLFPAFAIFGHAFRAMLPTVPATGAVVAIRAIGDSPKGPAAALGEAVLFAAIVAAGTLYSERALLREMLGYLRGRSGAVPGAAA
jgi:O-antigen/teichoic acid export membrane protein